MSSIQTTSIESQIAEYQKKKRREYYLEWIARKSETDPEYLEKRRQQPREWYYRNKEKANADRAQYNREHHLKYRAYQKELYLRRKFQKASDSDV